MNQFENISRNDLQKSLLGLVSYRQGCIDSFRIIQENHLKAIEVYNQKIQLYQDQIDKLYGKL
jgi:hypothetical protein